jgi:calcineurin-like phosphoesterase family protein
MTSTKSLLQGRSARLKRTHLMLTAATLAVALWLACGGRSAPGNPIAPPGPTPPPILETVVFSGAGDIASCTTMAVNERVAKILDGIDGLVFTTGDNAYERGTIEEFQKCYDPTWGRHRARTRPSPGNHDYYTPGAAGYFQYYGELAGPSGLGYYSFDYGAWKILSLNSNVPAGSGSAQYNWVAEELRNTTAKCTLAYWHHPVFSSGYEGNMPNMRAIWQLLYDSNAEVVLVGHSHNYERFAPQDLSGQPRPRRGIREFVVGTGGNHFTGLEALKANSEVFNTDSFGILKLTLAPTSYTWEFIPAAGATFSDSGSDVCF